MSIYLGNKQVAVIMPNETKPVGLDEICNHTFISGDVTYDGERIYPYTFYRTPITSFSGPNVKRFSNAASPTTDGTGTAVFSNCTSLTSVNFPELVSIGTSGGSQFYNCNSLTSISLPKVTTFGTGGYQFWGCTSLSNISFPELTTFGGSGYQFTKCTSLTTINSTSFPKLTTFVNTGHQFEECISLVTVDIPTLTTFGTGGYQFNKCYALKTVNLPKLTGATGDYAFGSCTSLEHIFLNKGSVQNNHIFRGCTQLKTAVLPHIGISATAMGTYVFYGDTALQAVDIKTTKVGDYDFQGCTNFNTLVLRNTSMASLANVRAFTNTPFASGKAGGIIYVPESLLANYQAGTNWVTILGYGNGTQNSIKTIESTHTDPDAPIDLTLYYADGTAIS